MCAWKVLYKTENKKRLAIFSFGTSLFSDSCLQEAILSTHSVNFMVSSTRVLTVLICDKLDTKELNTSSIYELI